MFFFEKGEESLLQALNADRKLYGKRSDRSVPGLFIKIDALHQAEEHIEELEGHNPRLASQQRLRFSRLESELSGDSSAWQPIIGTRPDKGTMRIMYAAPLRRTKPAVPSVPRV